MLCIRRNKQQERKTIMRTKLLQRSGLKPIFFWVGVLVLTHTITPICHAESPQCTDLLIHQIKSVWFRHCLGDNFENFGHWTKIDSCIAQLCVKAAHDLNLRYDGCIRKEIANENITEQEFCMQLAERNS